MNRTHENAALTIGTLSLLVVAVLAGSVRASAQTELQTYRTKYYVLRTDLDDKAVREAIQRITLMAEEYYRRTKDFSGAIRQRLPFYLFKNRADYYANGGLQGSAGIFTGTRLMAVAGEKNTDFTWHVIQHEGFHQFVQAVIGGDMPPWVNEGLAEYFALAVFTGDGYVTGVIPPQRVAMVRQSIAENRFKTIRKMMQTDQEIWNTHVTLRDAQAGANYLHAWSMVHFLAHADDGKYRRAFGKFIRDVSRGKRWEWAWEHNFGKDVAAFEDRWRDYWLNLPNDPTADLYTEARVATLTSFLARAFSQRQYFATIDEFFAAADAGELKTHEEDWLPPTLLENALAEAREKGTWSIKRIPGRTMLVCEVEDGRLLEGSFRIRNRRVQSVEVKVKKPRK